MLPTYLPACNKPSKRSMTGFRNQMTILVATPLLPLDMVFFRDKAYFTLPYVYLYSLIFAALDSFTSQSSDPDPYNFETFCMRALVIFTYWLIVRLVAERAERRGRSYKATMISAIFLIPIAAGLLSLLLLWI